jgi:cyclase
MVNRHVRRRLLKGAFGAGLCALTGLSPGLRSVLRAQPAAALDLTRLADDLVVISGAGGNVVVAASADALLTIDGGHAASADALLERIGIEFPGRAIRTLINTHWHPDFTGLNRIAGETGAAISAHENTRLWLGVRIDHPWDGSVYEPLPSDARPNDTFYTTHETTIGARPVRLGYLLQAHTDGDIYAHFPDANVIAVGGVVSGEGWPLIDWRTGGWLGGLIDALDRLIELADGETRFVPGYGPVLTRADLVEQRAMFETVYDRLLDLFVAARDADEAVAAAPAREYEARWGDPELFIRLAFESIGLYLTPDV